MRDPFPHQVLAVDLLRAALRSGKKRPILSLGCGAGKTKIASDIFHMARAKGKRCLFVADQITLIDQTIEAFYEEGHREIGAIQGNHPMTDYSRPVQVASIQTLARRALPEFDLAIFDEIHTCFQTHRDIIEDNPNKPIIGLSATPWTRGLGNTFDCLIVPATAQELIDAGRQLPLVAYAPFSPDLSKVKIKAGEYDEGALSIVMQDNKLVADAVQTWKDLGEGRPTLGYAVDRAHGQMMCDRFNKAGIPSGYIDGDTPKTDRDMMKSLVEGGTIKVVWSIGTMIKGVDWLVSCGIDCQPTKSHMRHVQKCGRVVRTTTGEQHGLWLDHAGNCLRLGMPVDIIRIELCTKQKGEKSDGEAMNTKPTSLCPKCKAVKTAKVCVCGYESKKESDLSEGAGQLARIDGGKAGPKKAEPTLFERQEWYAQLRGYQLAKNKSDGWLAHAYKDKFGAYPNDMRNVLPMKVGPEVSNYIKAKAIRYAKGMQKYGQRKAG